MDAFFSTLAVLFFISVLLFIVFKKNFSSQGLTSQITPQLSIQMVHSNILKEIKNVKEFSTIRVPFDSIIDFSNNKQIFGKDIPFSEQKLVLSYSGVIVCGCDLDRINLSQSFFNNNHLTITLPYSQIMDIYPEMATIKIHSQKSQIFADKIDLDLQNKLISADIETKRAEYIASGILSNSNERITKYLNSIVAPMGVVAEINFVENNQLPANSQRLLTD